MTPAIARKRRVGIVGCRPPRGDFGPYRGVIRLLREFLETLPLDIVVVSGGASGVDSLAACEARYRGIEVVEHFPDYVRYPRDQAPLERNTLIANDVDELHAFPAAWSRGTWDTVRKARARGIPVAVHEVRP